jgi:hypothetical protein
MKRGPKTSPPAIKTERGTFQPFRDAGTMEIVAFDDLPVTPDWLTEAGKSAWMDNISRVSATKFATEMDSDLFGTWCNMIGAAASAWKAGEVPPTTHITEIRRLAELFGLAGRKSRVGQVADGTKAANPFARLRA